MAVQETTHTPPNKEVNTAQTNLNPNEDIVIPEGEQTGGNRSFHTNDGPDPHFAAEGTSYPAQDIAPLPEGKGHGITNEPAGEERAEQEKVVGK